MAFQNKVDTKISTGFQIDRRVWFTMNCLVIPVNPRDSIGKNDRPKYGRRTTHYFDPSRSATYHCQNDRLYPVSFVGNGTPDFLDARSVVGRYVYSPKFRTIRSRSMVDLQIRYYGCHVFSYAATLYQTRTLVGHAPLWSIAKDVETAIFIQWSGPKSITTLPPASGMGIGPR